MRRLFLLLLFAPLACVIQDVTDETARWERRARNVTITRDDWGIAHVRAETDADAVFGMMYAQAEDDFNRVETNYINAMGRLAEAEGEAEIYRDLRMKLFIDPDSMKALYEASQPWLKALMDAYADGLNFYLYKNPEVKPRVITRFEPWMALTFSEGSIGGDIERVNVRSLGEFYDSRTIEGAGPASPAQVAVAEADEGEQWFAEPTGSNGIAIAPANTAGGHALLLINPHTSFFFRSEIHVTSDEGLNVYGAVTWGQFFVYQGFNETAGWMHTSSGVDNIDEYLETIVQREGRYFYRYGNEERPVTVDTIVVPFRTDSGMARRSFTVYRTHHGPIVREADGKWVSVRMMQEPLKALTQSYSRTKAKNYAGFLETMRLHTNSSNNTLFADGEGNIAYFHANFVPRRETRFDWRRPVDGSSPATEWGPLLSVEDAPLVVNPASGWVYNTNNSPWSAAGPDSPKQADYAPYVETASENARGLHAIRLLDGRKEFTIESLIEAAYDSYQPGFAELIPPLVTAYDAAPAGALKTRLAEQVAMLRDWDFRWSVSSVPTSLAVFYATELGNRASSATAQQRLQALAAASDKLAADFGNWRTPWGEINRFQRLTGDIVQPFNDSGPSIPVGFTSGRWGSLASFGARAYSGTKRWYGTSGNSFVAVVEFGDSVRARAVTAGGESGNPRSAHFNDQAQRYSTGDLREVYFYPSQLRGHVEREYHPGS
jgi:acyl-homoserine-lactone acylase